MMKILIITYAVSLLVLLAIYICSLFIKRESTDKEPWYVYALIVAFAPLTALVILYILVSTYIQGKKQKKIVKMREEKEAQERKYNQEAIAAYHKAAEQPHESHSFMFGMTAQTIANLIKEKDYDSIMQYFDKLSLPEGASLFIEECEQIGRGDKSKLFVETPEGAYDLRIWDYIKAEDHIDAAWQAYLLYKMWHILPLFWHANYDRRTYLYDRGDAAYIILLRKEHENLIKNAVEPLIIEPDAVKAANGKYYVSCCYWSDFEGLINEIVEITISTGHSISFKDIDKKVLYKYECGMRF